MLVELHSIPAPLATLALVYLLVFALLVKPGVELNLNVYLVSNYTEGIIIISNP